jgi:hypothetical protein
MVQLQGRALARHRCSGVGRRGLLGGPQRGADDLGRRGDGHGRGDHELMAQAGLIRVA